MSEPRPGEALRATVGMRVGRRITWASVAGAVMAAAAGALTSQNIRGQRGFGWVDGVTLAVYLVLTISTGTVWGYRDWMRALEWLAEESEPTVAEQRKTLSLPMRYSVMSMGGWIGAVVIWSVYTGVSHPAASVVRVSASIFLGGLTTSALIYLLIESALRPIVAIALASSIPEHNPSPGVRTRLIASWAVGADVFLIMIGLTFLGRSSSEPPSRGAIWFIVGAGLIAGTLVVHVAARSFATPLRNLRAAVARVEAGQLDVSVPVDDGGEMGLLQAGFNHMVAGLRERNALQDLFGRQVGEEVARHALQMGVRLGGERREVGVLFVDIIGSTELSLRYPPDRVVELLNRFFSAIVRAVAAEGGWVNKFQGDGALCVFGAPIPMEDHADRALRAARTIRAELLALAAAHPELDAAIGVSAGAVVAGNVGTERRYEYTVIGTPVNAAARLTDEAKKRLSRVLAGHEAVSRSTVEGDAWKVADEMTLRGMHEPVLVYEPAHDATREPAAVG